MQLPQETDSSLYVFYLSVCRNDKLDTAIGDVDLFPTAPRLSTFFVGLTICPHYRMGNKKFREVAELVELEYFDKLCAPHYTKLQTIAEFPNPIYAFVLCNVMSFPSNY